MEKKILIAVDESEPSKKAMEYAVTMGSIINNLSYVLIHVQPQISDFLLEDAKTGPRARSLLKDVVNKNQENSERILNESKACMIESGADEKRIEVVTRQKVMGTAKDILQHAEQSLYDAVVIGNRGVSRLAESFVGSVTNAVLEHSSIIPVWAVGGVVTSFKLMVAVDGSESALKALDHVGFMFNENTDMKITLLHVTPSLRDYCTIEFDEKGDTIQDMIARGDKRCVESFYTHALHKFKGVGIKENQIDYREVKSTLNIGKTIMDEAKKGGFGTVVCGRRGINKSFFMGSVSRYILTYASDCAVWLVP